MVENNVICILAMHRSGSSLAARVLNLLGLELGPQERLVRPGPDNPEGFWEHQDFQRINDRLLHRLGGTWHRPPVMPPCWAERTDLGDLREQARRCMERDFGSSDCWGWKDPRTCLTLAFWQAIIPGLRYVLCLRHPLEVARSLERRNGFSLQKGVYLWLLYTRAALNATQAEQRMLLVYDALLEDWRRQLPLLARVLEVPGGIFDSRRIQAVQACVDPRLRHHWTGDAGARATPTGEPLALAANLAQTIYVRLCETSGAGAPETDRQFETAIRALSPAVAEQEEAARSEARERWNDWLGQAEVEIDRTVPPGAPFILLDEEQWGAGAEFAGRPRIPFPEADGTYGGPPANDRAAIISLECLRARGASSLAVAWPAFWWLEHYQGFHEYLRSHYRCVERNERLIVFDLGNGGIPCES